MAATFDFSFAERPPSAGSSPEGNAQPTTTASTTSGEAKAPEKTISCVSCRRRKLKCDRIKPRCGTCARLRHECEYPERRRNLGQKRRNMKELEARLAEVETRLVSERERAPDAKAPAATAATTSLECDWDTLGTDMNTTNLDDPTLLDPWFETTGDGCGKMDVPLMDGDFFSRELIELGLEEPLPPPDMIEELDEIYFTKFHPTMPIMHKYRYYTSLNKPPQARPPVCLRYAMWALAASLSQRHTAVEDILYERARRYIQVAEMKGQGEQFVSTYHAQAWSLIAFFEAKKTYFTRSWMSTGRAVRLVQMLGFYRIDSKDSEVRQIIPAARDWTEIEERRRTFWGAFYGDRWASSGTGWPILINETEIMTNLPSSEEAFKLGTPQESVSLADALTPEGAGKLSSFGGVILSAALYGKNFEHLHRTGPNENPADPVNGEFWKRHRKMENVLSSTFMFMPDHLRLPAGLRDMSIVFIHMNLHSSSICLHQVAIVAALKHDLNTGIVRQSQARCLMAAEEITNIMRLICHVDASNLNPWVGFCLYVAAGVFLKDLKSEKPGPQSLGNIEFLLAAMAAIGQKHSITKHFSAQLELDAEGAGLKGAGCKLPKTIPNTPINGLLADRNGMPMTVENLQSYAASAVPTPSTDDSGLASFLRTGCRDFTSVPGLLPKRANSSLTSSPHVQNGAENSTGSAMRDAPSPAHARKDLAKSSGASYTFPYRQADLQVPAAGAGAYVESTSHAKPADRYAFPDPSSSTSPREWKTPEEVYDDSEGINAFLQNSGWDVGGGSSQS